MKTRPTLYLAVDGAIAKPCWASIGEGGGLVNSELVWLTDFSGWIVEGPLMLMAIAYKCPVLVGLCRLAKPQGHDPSEIKGVCKMGVHCKTHCWPRRATKPTRADTGEDDGT